MSIDFSLEDLPATITGIYYALATPPVQTKWEKLSVAQQLVVLSEAGVVEEDFHTFACPFNEMNWPQQEAIVTGMALLCFRLKAEQIAEMRRAA